MNRSIQILLCHHCGFSLERDLDYRSCSNCFACTGCEIYICPHCGAEIVVKEKTDPKKEMNK